MVDQLFTLHGSWKLTMQCTYVLGTRNCIPLGILLGVLLEYEVPQLLLKVNRALYNQSECCVFYYL